MRLHILCLALAGLSLSGPVPAEQPRQQNYRSDYDDCVKDAIGRGMGPNAALEACTESVTDGAKHEMNVLYKRIHDDLQAKSPSDATEFETAQRSWLAYRNAHCHLAQKLIGDPETVICPMDLNIERVNELRRLSGQ